MRHSIKKKVSTTTREDSGAYRDILERLDKSTADMEQNSKEIEALLAKLSTLELSNEEMASLNKSFKAIDDIQTKVEKKIGK